MRILFTTAFEKAPSAELNAASLSRLGELPDVHIDLHGRDYARYDLVLFMGYDADVAAARRARRDIIVGIVDPRPTLTASIADADFLLVNGFESRDWYAGIARHIFVYPIYPELPEPAPAERPRAGLVLGYHGNTTHLRAMHPRITRAIARLAGDTPLELRAMYNAGSGGPVRTGLEDVPNVTLRHVPWSLENYACEIAGVDIGLVPGLMPVSADTARTAVQNSAGYAAHASDYLLHFKATSNAGRIYVYAHYGIPVVADMYPSALQSIEDGVDGFVCYSTGAWLRALTHLAADPAARRAMGARLRTRLDPAGARDEVHRRLIAFIGGLDGSDRVRESDTAAAAASGGGTAHGGFLRRLMRGRQRL